MDYAQLRKLEKRSVAPDSAPPPDTLLTGIVKVKEKGYRPARVRVRSEIGEGIFTAEFLASDLPQIEGDPGVEVVSISQRIPLQKMPSKAAK
jgi:hypothetical protein